MTLKEFIDKLIQLRDQSNAGEFIVKVPYYFDMEIEGSKTPWCDDTDITDEEICINEERKTVTISDKYEIKKSYLE